MGFWPASEPPKLEVQIKSRLLSAAFAMLKIHRSCRSMERSKASENELPLASDVPLHLIYLPAIVNIRGSLFFFSSAPPPPDPTGQPYPLTARLSPDARRLPSIPISPAASPPSHRSPRTRRYYRRGILRPPKATRGRRRPRPTGASC